MSFLKNIRMYRKWWKTWGTLPVMPWLNAAIFFKAAKYEQAIEFYRKGLEKVQNHPAELCARLDLAYCLFKTGKLKEAQEELKYAASRSPQSREAQVRLARFQQWIGKPLEAAWTIRRALRNLRPDCELVALLIHSSLDGGAPSYLLQEGLKLAEQLRGQAEGAGALPDYDQLKIALVRMRLMKGDFDEALEDLERLVNLPSCSIEGLIAYAEELVQQEKVAFARQQLRRALLLVPQQPRVLSLLAESYLKAGPFQNIDYGVQLATIACQHTAWMSPREMHILAEAYFQLGDKMAALLMASKAKQAGSDLIGSYHAVKSLDKLIDNLSSGSLA